MNRRVLIALAVVLALLVGATAAFAGGGGGKNSCTRIQDGTLLGSDDVLIELGYDEWGYNYQAHMFNGFYCDSYRDAQWCQEWKDVSLIMKWNDAWLANTDCGIDGVGGDPDGLLDRHHGFPTYIGSGAWLTNHMRDTYEDSGQVCEWDSFTKFIAAPADAVKTGAYWYTADGVEIGPVIWIDFAIIQDVFNDPCGGSEGISYLSADHAGFGGW